MRAGMRRHRMVRCQKGMVLLEVLIGVTILAVVMVALLQGFQAGILGTKQVDDRSVALNLAQSQIEYIKGQPYQTYDGEGNPVAGEGYATLDGEHMPPGFTPDDIQFTVSNLDDGENPLQQITVTVSYGDNRSVVLSGYHRYKE